MTTVVLDSGAMIGDAPAQTDKCGLVYLDNIGSAVQIVRNLTKESDIASSDAESGALFFRLGGGVQVFEAIVLGDCFQGMG